MSTPDMFLTRAEKEEKKRRQKSKTAVSDLPKQTTLSTETKQPTKVYSIFQKTSVRKQQLFNYQLLIIHRVEQADTSFKNPIAWKTSGIPSCHYCLPSKSFGK